MSTTESARVSDPTVDSVKLGFIFLLSAVVLAESSRECHRSKDCTGYRGWAVACSVLSLVFTGALVACYHLSVIPTPAIPVSNGNVITVAILTVWWAVGAGCMTFGDPFSTAAGNGYFCSWACFYVAGHMAAKLVPHAQAAINTVYSAGADVAMIFFASCVLLIQALTDCEESCDGKFVWAIICGGVSALACVIGMLLKDRVPSLYFAGALCLWWSVGWIIITFHGPYETVGNGYFSASAGFLFSLRMLLLALDVFKFLESAGLSYRAPGDVTHHASAPTPTEAALHAHHDEDYLPPHPN
eukprot:gene18028-27766_t